MDHTGIGDECCCCCCSSRDCSQIERENHHLNVGRACLLKPYISGITPSIKKERWKLTWFICISWTGTRRVEEKYISDMYSNLGTDTTEFWGASRLDITNVTPLADRCICSICSVCSVYRFDRISTSCMTIAFKLILPSMQESRKGQVNSRYCLEERYSPFQSILAIILISKC